MQTTDAPAKPRYTYESEVPDGALDWWPLGSHPKRQVQCVCLEPVIGKPGTPFRYTCRKCGGKTKGRLYPHGNPSQSGVAEQQGAL